MDHLDVVSFIDSGSGVIPEVDKPAVELNYHVLPNGLSQDIQATRRRPTATERRSPMWAGAGCAA